jgi:hypothetical protein
VFLVGDRLVVATFVLETCASAPTFRRFDEFIAHRHFVFDMNVSIFQSTASALRTIEFWFASNEDQAIGASWSITCSRDSNSVLKLLQDE